MKPQTSSRLGGTTEPTLAEWASAAISDDGQYRYDLTRRWAQPYAGLKLALWVMLNPSTADATEDDPTIRRVRGFTQREGFDGFVVVNVCALRATDPKHLLGHDDPIGPDNAATIYRWMRDPRVEIAIAAWGAFKLDLAAAGEVESAAAYARRPLLCLGKTRNGSPRHPLYVKGDTPLERFP